MKKSKFGAKPTGRKQSKSVEQGNNLYQLQPKWSFVKCDMDHEKWGIFHNVEHLGQMLARFKEWERITWGEILTTTAGRNSNTQSHPMPIGVLKKEAQKRIAELNLNEFDTLYSLTMTGRQHVWGIMIEETGTFELLWYDANHEI